MYRTNTCGELTKKQVGKKVSLAGWDHSRRDHGNIIFIDLRDRYGLTQIVFDPSQHEKVHALAEKLRREDVIQVTGTVRARPEGMGNPNLKTGEIEVLIEELVIFSSAETPPLEVDDRIEAGEDMRMKYRYLDLRRPIMLSRLEFRHKLTQVVRNYFSSNGFMEIETPLLVRATPEGARDYLVPSRVHTGSFYALPQSPQLYKQILMVAGVDRYFQLARCLRDEDLRKDRQPEHTQIDFEMSFVHQKDIIEYVSGLFSEIVKDRKGINLDPKKDFPILTYEESMENYGTDKPDLRFGLKLFDVTDIVKDSEFSVFQSVVAAGGIVKCINPEKDIPRKEIDSFISFCQDNGAKGMAWMRVSEKGLESNIAKYFPEEIQKKLIDKVGAKPGSVLMFIADKKKNTNEIISKLRVELGTKLNLIKEGDLKFCWVVDFPLFDFDEDTGAWTPAHHMFSMPKEEHLPLLEKDPGKVLADLFDVVLNGVELGSGSIRISRPDIQERVMKVIGLSHDEAMKKFGFLLEAYKYGGPPHGGMGIGLDRLTALLLGLTDIREVIAFPKNKAAQCPMDGSPSTVDAAQVKELGIKHETVKKK